MDLESLKSNYSRLGQEEIRKEKLQKMLSVKNHPVLKKIRIQLLFESLAWGIFLTFFYDFFDGHTKPFFWSLLLILAIALVLIHNILGYRITSRPINGLNILDSLNTFLSE